MKTLKKITGLLVLMLASAGTFAAETPQADSAKQPGMNMHQGMANRMAGMSEEQKDQHMRAMQEHMLTMHELSDKIIAEQDPAKKQALKDQQLELMKAHKAQMMGHMQKMMHQ
ncbi:MAG: hypothetical protein CVV13_04230 [Gammaproteobacteria bacterium HGW-Gammaproteobacteria-3]|nr:MAG: hypothetical protein CVV13_04230 [Gammaproteobacteria bacterium HGW-Gammaproteobacteria-3]